MKTIKYLIASVIIACTALSAHANTDLSTLTQDDGMQAIQAGDTMGLEVIPRKELEEVRGEAVPLILYYAALYAPTLTALMSSAIANHFPVMLIKQAWREAHS